MFNKWGVKGVRATPPLVVYSRNLITPHTDQFEINKIWQSAQPKKAQTHEKTLTTSPEGTLIPSILLPAHFMPRSAPIDVKMVLQIQEYQCLSVCVPACATHLFIECVCECVFCVGFFSPLFYFSALSFTSVEPPVWTTSEQQCSRDTSHRWKEQRLFFFMYTAHLNCMSLLLCFDLASGG